MSVFKPRRRTPDGEIHESPNYSCKFRLDTWRTHKVFALHTRDKRVAEMKENELRVELEKEAMGMLPPRSVRETLRKPLNGLLDAFLADLKAKGRTPATLLKYGSSLRILFQRLGWVDLRSVSAASFTRWRISSPLSAKSKNDMLANTCTFFRWLEHQRLLQENPLRYVERIDTRGGQQCRRALSADEVRRLLAVATPARALVYLTAVNTGLRRNELNRLRWCDFHLDGESPKFTVPASISKNRKEVTLDLHRDVADALMRHRPKDWAPFQHVLKGHVPRTYTLRRDLEAAGIPLLDATGRRIDLHALRVTFGTLLLVHGVHARVAQELMRHSDIKLTTKLYTDASQLPLAVGLAALPSFTQRNPSRAHTQKHTQKHTQTGVSAVPVPSSSVTASPSGESLQSA